MSEEETSEHVVAADVAKRSAMMVCVSTVTVVVVGAGAVGTDVAADVVETNCMIEEEDRVKVAGTAEDELAGGAMVECSAGRHRTTCDDAGR